MIKSVKTTRSALARPAPQPLRTVGFSAWVLYPPGGAQEGSPFQGFPTWRFRVLKTALRLRPRRALSSASGQKHPFSTMPPGKKSLKFRNLCLTNHIPEIRVTLVAPLLSAFPCIPQLPGNSTSIPDAVSRVNSPKFAQIRPKKYFESDR